MKVIKKANTNTQGNKDRAKLIQTQTFHVFFVLNFGRREKNFEEK